MNSSIFFDDTCDMVFYDIVKKLVKQNTHFTLKDFIESLEINYGTYQTQRKSGNLPRANEAVNIAEALGVTVEYLVTGEDDLTEYEHELLQVFKSLNEQGKLVAISAVKALSASFLAGYASAHSDDSKSKPQAG